VAILATARLASNACFLRFQMVSLLAQWINCFGARLFRAKLLVLTFTAPIFSIRVREWRGLENRKICFFFWRQLLNVYWSNVSSRLTWRSLRTVMDVWWTVIEGEFFRSEYGGIVDPPLIAQFFSIFSVHKTKNSQKNIEFALLIPYNYSYHILNRTREICN